MKSTIIIFFLTVLAATAGITACKGQEMDEETTKVQSSHQNREIDWQVLAGKKIYFGHQSVGNNILEGVRDILQESSPGVLTIAETHKHPDIAAGTLAHSAVGKNDDPLSKIESFRTRIENGLGGNVDIALFKFCFVDIDSRTDVNVLFEKYRDTMAELKTKYPRTTFAHCTVPLLGKEKVSLKSWVKRLLGKSDGFFDNRHNKARNEFNALLVKEYQGKEPVFDLAGVSSTYPDGSREMFTFNGAEYYALVPAYTDDGGHLNKTGRKVVAEQFLLFLADIPLL